MEFNPDGTLKVTKRKVSDHLIVLRLVDELHFSLGKKLFVDVLRGEENTRIKKLDLHKKIYHGALGGYDGDELLQFIEILIVVGFIEIELQKGKYPVLSMTKKGKEELNDSKEEFMIDASLKNKDLIPSKIIPPPVSFTVAPITSADKEIFAACDFFLGQFTNEQKKAIIDSSVRQLCIAGAGSGKTSVLTHKIAYLVKFLGVSPESILAITFTRKAKQEMIARLAELLPDVIIKVETFNSFAEKELLKKGNQLYGKQKRMASPKEFFTLVLKAIASIGFDLDTFLNHYFLARERRGKEQRELFFSFLYDFRAVLDTYLSQDKPEEYFATRMQDAVLTEKITAQNIVKLAKIVIADLEHEGLRTYSDQIIDINRLYQEHPQTKETYPWVLVDEYQDVNPLQVKLIHLVATKNLFVVGDPRQSIYAWRGSNPQIIYDYITKETTVVELTTNFRSTESVVDFSNELIGQTNRGRHFFTPLSSSQSRPGLVSFVKMGSEEGEAIAVVDQIKSMACDMSDIFVLSRTNKGLDKIRDICDQQSIPYLLRTDEKQERNREAREQEITLSTVHAIKGLEAEMVFVVGATMNNYPCKTKDHRFVDLLAAKEGYDQFEEERRILYVACTRAKKELRISYVGAPSPFLNEQVLKKVTHSAREVLTDLSSTKNPKETSVEQITRQRSGLKRWRFLESQERNIPAYMIFSDRALESLLDLQPLSTDELDSVNGLGKVKIREFGRDILFVLHS